MGEKMLFDGHAHLLPTDEARERLLASMDSLQIERAVVVGAGILSPQRLARQIRAPFDFGHTRDLHCDNRGVLAQCRKSGGRLQPFYFANPWEPTDDYCRSGTQFVGLKLAPAVHGLPLEAPGNLAYVRAAVELGHPVYLHCLDHDGFRVSDLASLAARMPENTFILGHGGIGELDYDGVDLIAPFPNVHFETSGTFKAVVQYALKVLGARRVLFGSEYPLQSAAAELAKMRDLGVPEYVLRKVLGGNTQRLLGEGRAC
jgi:predicted TIM-barrel fold metal-dependent hydrolase